MVKGVSEDNMTWKKMYVTMDAGTGCVQCYANIVDNVTDSNEPLEEILIDGTVEYHFVDGSTADTVRTAMSTKSTFFNADLGLCTTDVATSNNEEKDNHGTTGSHGRGGGGDFAATGHVKHGVDGRGLVDLTGGGGLIRVGQVADSKTQQGAVGVAHQGDGPGENMVVDTLLEHVDGVAPGVGGGGVGAGGGAGARGSSGSIRSSGGDGAPAPGKFSMLPACALSSSTTSTWKIIAGSAESSIS
jgi:hypothetical protein